MAIYRTAENAKDERLLTNWYQNDYRECANALLKLLPNYGYQLQHRDDTYGEFIFVRQRDTLDVRVISMSKRETAIDFIISSNILFDFGKSKNIIADFYEKLKRDLRFYRK